MMYNKSIILIFKIIPVLLLLLGIIFHKQILVGIAFITAGTAGILYRTEYAWSHIHQQKKWFRINLSQRDFKIMRFAALIIGPIFILVGLLVIFGLIDLKL